MVIGWGMIVLLQFGCWTIMLVEKKQELEARIVVSTVLFVGILCIFWLSIIYLIPPLLEYIFGDPLDNTSSLLLYFVLLPLVVALLVAQVLYRKFREPLSTTESRRHEETQ
jgi:O-antigen/teichoic acid export membrane protein